MAAPDLKDPAARSFRATLLAKDRERRAKRANLVKASANEPPRRNDLLPGLQLVQRAPQALRAPPRNVRALDPAHVKEVANAISTLGFSVPVLIDQDDKVLDGLVRCEAAKQLGLATVPCVVAAHLTTQERRLLRLAVNKLGEKGTWNLPELKLEIAELLVDEVPIEITGFDQAEIDAILVEDDAVAVEDGPLAPTPGAAAVAQVGDVYLLGPHRVICGDACDPAVLRALMDGDVATVVFTDQPYNVTIQGHVTGGDHREFEMGSGEMTDEQFLDFNDRWIAAALAHLVGGGLLATFIDWRAQLSVTAAALAQGLVQLNLVIWVKTNAGMGSLFRSQHELVPFFKKGSAPHINNISLGRKGRHRSNVWSYPGASSLGSDARQGLQHHPTVKPVVMLVDALHDVTNRDDIVLDPFLGSGSTLIAAETCGRICRGVELDPLYVDVIVRRYREVTGHAAVLQSSGETFEAVEQRRHRAAQPAAPSQVQAAPSSATAEPTVVPRRVRQRTVINPETPPGGS